MIMQVIKISEVNYGYMSVMMVSFAIAIFSMIGIGLYQEAHRYD